MTDAAHPPRPQIRHYIMTSRFNQSTADQNVEFRHKKNVDCIYCSPSRIAASIPPNSVLFVLELNISTNKIMGIGMLKNVPRSGFFVYDKGNYNRYTYVGKFRIDVENMTEEEKDFITILESYCFKGNYHMKRGSGITKFPLVVFYLILFKQKINIMDIIKDMFRARVAAAAAAEPRS
jgi:hypothetical protein